MMLRKAGLLAVLWAALMLHAPLAVAQIGSGGINKSTSSGTGTPGGSNGQLQYNNLGAFGGFTPNGDCAFTPGTGLVVCLKTNGTVFAQSATTDTTNASNISAGTLPAGRLPNPSASTLGGVQSATCGAGNHINQISTSGVPGCTADSGGGTGTVTNPANLLTDKIVTGGTNGTTDIKTNTTGAGVVTALGVAVNATGGVGLVTAPTSHGNSDYSIATSDRYVVTSATLSAPRVWTLPPISATLDGVPLTVADEFGGASPTNPLAIPPNGTDTVEGVNNASASTIGVARGGFTFVANNTTKNWKVTANTVQQAYSCSAGQFATAQSALGVTTCSAAALTIASGAKALATGAISSAACTSAQTATATGTLTTDVVTASFNGDPTAVTGYVPLVAGMLTIIAYPTADTANFKVCNNTSSSITPGAITLNWRVVR